MSAVLGPGGGGGINKNLLLSVNEGSKQTWESGQKIAVDDRGALLCEA